jgi:hypothetical protein
MFTLPKSATALPLLVVAPLLAVLLRMDEDGFLALVLSLLLGTPALGLVGSVGAGLVLGARRGGALLALLILPLFIPILIFGAAAVEAARNRPARSGVVPEGGRSWMSWQCFWQQANRSGWEGPRRSWSGAGFPSSRTSCNRSRRAASSTVSWSSGARRIASRRS